MKMTKEQLDVWLNAWSSKCVEMWLREKLGLLTPAEELALDFERQHLAELKPEYSTEIACAMDIYEQIQKEQKKEQS